MGYLERIFLGTMLLVGLLIFFMFGLYFNIGDMVRGSFGGGTLRVGQDLELIRDRRRLGFETEPVHAAPMPQPAALTGAHRPTSAVNYDRFVSRGPAVSFDILLDREVRRLQRKGFIDEEFINMRAYYEVDTNMVATIDRYDQLIEAGDWEGAIALLMDAKEHVDKRNPLGLRDIMQYLQQALIQAGKDDLAKANIKELLDLQDHIRQVEERAEIHNSAQGKETSAKMHEQFGKLREAIDKMDQVPVDAEHPSAFEAGRQIMAGKPITVNARAIPMVKAEFQRQMESGQIPPEAAAQLKEMMEHIQANPGR